MIIIGFAGTGYICTDQGMCRAHRVDGVEFEWSM